MKSHQLFFPPLFLFVLSCATNKEEPIAVIAEPILPQSSVTLIFDNPVNSSMLVKTMGDDSKTYTANLQYDTIRIFTDTPKSLYIEQSMFIWHKMTAEPNDTIVIKTEKDGFRVFADQQKRTLADIRFYALADSLSRIKFRNLENFEDLFFEIPEKIKPKKETQGLIGVKTLLPLSKGSQRRTADIIENKSEFRRLFDTELEIYQYKVQLLDSLKALNQLRQSSYNYYKDELFFRALFQSLIKHERSGDPYFETYLLNHLNDKLLSKNDYGLLDNFLASFISSYILQGKFERIGNSAGYDYEKAIQDMPTYFSGDLLEKLNSVAINRLTEQNPNIDLFKDLAQNLKLDSGSKALLTRQIEDMIDADKLKNMSTDSLYLTSLNNDFRSFNKVMKSSKTELILVDLWASWCGPCFQQFAATSELEKEYSEKLSVVYISIDDYKSKWLQGVERAGLKDKTSFLSVNPRKSKILTDEWKVTAIPRFILMDKEGNILSENTSAPDSDQIRTLINQHISND
jgi:thiol-disulfide isomerase/thioredoxin